MTSSGSGPGAAAIEPLWLEAVTDAALDAALASWGAAARPFHLLALLPERDAAVVPLLQAACRRRGVVVAGGLFPELLVDDCLGAPGAVLLRVEGAPPPVLLEGVGEASAVPRTAEAAAAYVEEALGDEDEDEDDDASFLCLFDAEAFVGGGLLLQLLPGHPGACLEHGYAVPEQLTTATSADGNRIIRIDWRPPLDVYRELMRSQYGLEIDRDGLSANAVHLPFGILRADGEVLVRIPVAPGEDGSVLCAGEIPPSSVLAPLDARAGGSTSVPGCRRSFPPCARRPAPGACSAPCRSGRWAGRARAATRSSTTRRWSGSRARGAEPGAGALGPLRPRLRGGGGEVSEPALLTRSLQRFLPHTGFPVGLILAHAPGDPGSLVACRLQVAIGDRRLVREQGRTLPVPGEVLAAVPAVIEDGELVGPLGTRRPVAAAFSLPVEGYGHILLLFPRPPGVTAGLTEVFLPVLSRLATAIRLCQSHAREVERRAEHGTRHDALTGLPSASRFASELALSLAGSRESGRSCAVASPDLDDFVRASEKRGRDAGDAILVGLARRLEGLLLPGELLARMQGDEFALLVPDVPARRQAEDRVLWLQVRLNDPLAAGKGFEELTASAGIALFPAGGADPELIRRHAQMAMLEAKQAGRGPSASSTRSRTGSCTSGATTPSGWRRPSARGSPSSTTSRRWRCGPAGSSAPRPSSDGPTRTEARGPPATSCRRSPSPG